MMQYRALIIEDEPPAARRLIRLLSDLGEDLEIMTTLESVQDASTYLKTEKPDLIFLDIHLADGISFSIFDRVKVEAPIIFTTAYDQYAIQAFKHNSLDYLLKPVDRDELDGALEKFRSRQMMIPKIDVAAILEAMRQPQESYQARFMTTSGDKIRSVPVEDVAYFFGQQKFVFLVTNDGRRLLVDYTLTQLEDLLDPRRFFRINRQFIVGFSAIRHMYPHSKSRLRIELDPKPDMEAVVSIEKTPRFKEWIGK